MAKVIVKCNEKKEIVRFSSTTFEDLTKLDNTWYMTNLEGYGDLYSYPNSVYETYDVYGRPNFKLDNLNNIKEIPEDEKEKIEETPNLQIYDGIRAAEEIENIKEQLNIVQELMMNISMNILLSDKSSSIMDETIDTIFEENK